ncbi:MAG: hypothetical protein V1743_04460 [Nanoarchaeota archaeon]
MVNNYTYLGLFLDDPSKQVNLQEFENIYKKPHQTIRRHLNVLVKESILIEMRMGKFVFYKLNKNNPLLLSYLSICEKERTFLFLKNPLFKRLHELLAPSFNVANVLVFGSAAVSKNYNDIDLLVLSGDKNVWMALEGFEKIYHKKLHIVKTEEKDLTTTFITEITKKHIILNNHDYFVRLLYGN